MKVLEINLEVDTEIRIDLNTGEILTPLKNDKVSKRYSPALQSELNVWELHLIEGTARLRHWANQGRKGKGK